MGTRLLSPMRHRELRLRNWSFLWRWAIVLAALALVSAFLLSPECLTRLAVPENIAVSDFLARDHVDGLDFQRPARRWCSDSVSVQAVGVQLLDLQAVRVSLDAPPAHASALAYEFDYGYKGNTIRIFSDGSLEVRIGKQRFIQASIWGHLWGRLADPTPGYYVYYETAPISQLLRLVDRVFRGAVE